VFSSKTAFCYLPIPTFSTNEICSKLVINIKLRSKLLHRCYYYYYYYKKAVLLQRWLRDAPYIYIWVLWKSLRLPDYAHGYFSLNILWAFVPIDPMNVHTTSKSLALPIHEIIEWTQKIRAIPGYPHGPFSPKFLTSFCLDGPYNVPAKFEVCSFTCSWDNMW